LSILFHNDLRRWIYRLTGIRPIRLAIYKEALTHSSVGEINLFHSDTIHLSNERLEFLGDAILDAVIAEVLFNRFPKRDEGFLTEMRTRIVNREQMSDLAKKMGLLEYMNVKDELKRNRSAMKSIGGNALEALIGAIYLDRGYKKAQWFIIHRLVDQYLDIDKLMSTAVSYKAVFMKWAQKQQKSINWIHEFDVTKKDDRHRVTLEVEGENWFTESNKSRKKAEELCSEKACRKLDLNTGIS